MRRTRAADADEAGRRQREPRGSTKRGTSADASFGLQRPRERFSCVRCLLASRRLRKTGFNVLEKMYGAASGAIHRGRVKNGDDTLLMEGQEICRQAILKRLRSNQTPGWLDIVFGR